MSIAGEDLLSAGQEMMAKVHEFPDDANLWMNLATVMLCLGQRDPGLNVQAQALEMQRIYYLYARQQPAKLRLLLLMVGGELSANTPLDCLLENTDIDLIFYYLTPGAPLTVSIPEHDVLMVAVSESDDNLQVLELLEPALRDWPKPVLNAPQKIPVTGRVQAADLLQNAPGLLMPPTYRVAREVLQQIAGRDVCLAQKISACDFPIILRPVGSHGGHGLQKISNEQEVGDYLVDNQTAEFYLSRFVDYKNADGLYRKFRIALVSGEAYACHMAVSENWMIHYVNAGMYEDAEKRVEEQAFMADFDRFAERHQAALQAVYERTRLDYVCIDCAETSDGQLLVFEIDHAMVVHAMDPELQFPYKQLHMHKLQTAFRALLMRLTANSAD